MKLVTIIAGALLGLIFMVFGLNHFLKFIEIPGFEGQAKQFMDTLYGSGYLSFVKALEVVGGLLIAIPKTRNLGIIVLAPIIANILAFKIFLQKGGAILDPAFVLILVLFTVVLAFGGKRFFKGVLA